MNNLKNITADENDHLAVNWVSLIRQFLRNHRPAGLGLVLFFAFVMCVPGVANAQDGVISGTVTDMTGALLPGVTWKCWTGRVTHR